MARRDNNLVTMYGTHYNAVINFHGCIIHSTVPAAECIYCKHKLPPEKLNVSTCFIGSFFYGKFLSMVPSALWHIYFLNSLTFAENMSLQFLELFLNNYWKL